MGAASIVMSVEGRTANSADISIADREIAVAAGIQLG